PSTCRPRSSACWRSASSGACARTARSSPPPIPRCCGASGCPTPRPTARPCTAASAARSAAAAATTAATPSTSCWWSTRSSRRRSSRRRRRSSSATWPSSAACARCATTASTRRSKGSPRSRRCSPAPPSSGGRGARPATGRGARREMADQIRSTQIQADIVDLLKLAIERRASDLLITVGLPPMPRINGEWRPTAYETLNPTMTRRLMYALMDEKKQRNFEERKDLDFSFSLSGHGRYRVNVFLQRGSVGGVMRTIADDVLAFSDLGLPQEVADVARLPRGLVLVTGPTGSGKSTTLATMLDLINEEYSKHIVTI